MSRFNDGIERGAREAEADAWYFRNKAPSEQTDVAEKFVYFARHLDKLAERMRTLKEGADPPRIRGRG